MSISGLLAISAVMGIYTINFVATRYSLLHGLTSFDLVALRFGVAGTVLAPYFYCLGVRDGAGIGWRRASVLLVVAGSPYMVVFLSGLALAPAGHGAVLNSGAVPSVVFVILVWLGRQTFSARRAVALAMIVAGLVLVTGSSFSMHGQVLLGDLLLLASGLSWGLFLVLVRIWEVRPLQAAAITSVLSLIYLPVYVVVWYSGFRTASSTHVVLQAVWQGLVNSIASLGLMTYALRRLGAQVTALFSALVPLLTTLLAIPLLLEIPTAGQWAGVVIVAAGMLGAALL